LGAIARSNNLH